MTPTQFKESLRVQLFNALKGLGGQTLTVRRERDVKGKIRKILDTAYTRLLHPEVDSYGVAVQGKRPRHRKCRCEVPCLLFKCRARGHRGNRMVPWCIGGSSEEAIEDEYCSTCYCKAQDAKEKKSGTQRR